MNPSRIKSFLFLFDHKYFVSNPPLELPSIDPLLVFKSPSHSLKSIFDKEELEQNFFKVSTSQKETLFEANNEVWNLFQIANTIMLALDLTKYKLKQFLFSFAYSHWQSAKQW